MSHLILLILLILLVLLCPRIVLRGIGCLIWIVPARSRVF